MDRECTAARFISLPRQNTSQPFARATTRMASDFGHQRG
jgi:hypothetical protein